MSDWRAEFQYLLDRKILTRDEAAYLFGQIKSICDRENTQLQATIERLEGVLESVATKHRLLKGLSGYPPCCCKPGQLCMKHAAKDILTEIEQTLQRPKGT